MSPKKKNQEEKHKGLTKSICSIYNKGKERETSTLPICGLEIDSKSPVHELVVDCIPKALAVRTVEITSLARLLLQYVSKKS